VNEREDLGVSVKAGSVTCTIGARVIYASRRCAGAGCAQPLRVRLRLVLAHVTPNALVPVVLRAAGPWVGGERYPFLLELPQGLSVRPLQAIPSRCSPRRHGSIQRSSVGCRTPRTVAPMAGEAQVRNACKGLSDGGCATCNGLRIDMESSKLLYRSCQGERPANHGAQRGL
jgi:hypothetical protein